MLDRITPVVLTYDEEPNLARTLGALTWAREVLVVDSFSHDGTLRIARSFPNVRVLQRAFDDHCAQWSFALEATGPGPGFVLALDADYVVTPELRDELAALDPTEDVSGYRATFRYLVDGVPLRGTLYPPSVVLFRKGRARFAQDGHTQRLVVDHGRVEPLAAPILHDDRKPFARWLASQRKYAALEAEKLAGKSLRALSWPDRVRRVPFAAAPAVGAYCLLAQRGLLDGRAGLKYAGQRMLAEAMISLALLHRR
jgi:glycosyltransferase involved in cell wall biosynthesis